MPYPIELIFDDSWPPEKRSVLENAAARWRPVIVESLSPVAIEDRRVEGVLIRASIASGAPGGELARAGVSRVRPASAARGGLLPASAILSIDQEDFSVLEADGRLEAVLAHEIGHCLGIGTVWAYKDLLRGAGRPNVRFVGGQTCHEYSALCGSERDSTPVENHGGAGAVNKHWRESVFGIELMSTLVPGADNRLSRLTIASLEDLGYVVDYSRAEPFALDYTKSFEFDLDPAYVPQHKMTAVEPEILSDSALITELE